jgi:uncharacterized protein YhdP
VALGQNIASRYVRERVAARGADWRVTSGGIGWNQPAPAPAAGLKLAVAADALDVDAWLALKKNWSARTPPVPVRPADWAAMT